MILFIKNIDIEGPETLGEFFAEKGMDSQTIDLQSGDQLPQSSDDIHGVIVLGGPMNVYEEDKFPFLKDETEFIQKVLKAEIPFLGLCLGSQLLAKAAGAKVGRSPEEEIGFDDVSLTDDGKNDPFFEGCGESLNVFQWHGDMFEIPEEGKLLASGDQCPHQAFRVGPNAYGLQFHVEITEKSIREWSDRYFAKDKQALAQKKESMLNDYTAKEGDFRRLAFRLYENFYQIINETVANLRG